MNITTWATAKLGSLAFTSTRTINTGCSLFNDVSQKVMTKHGKKSIAVVVLGNICVGPTGCLNGSVL